jgi:hypothetical protein
MFVHTHKKKTLDTPPLGLGIVFLKRFAATPLPGANMTNPINVVYTTETPWSKIKDDFLHKHSGTPVGVLLDIDRRWRKLGKQAQSHGLVGWKYV